VTPELFIDAPWAQVKQFFITQARALGQEWFGIQGQTSEVLKTSEVCVCAGTRSLVY